MDNKDSRAKKILKALKSLVGSDKFLWASIIFFALESVWVAISFKFPMVFDERYHVGVIDYFTHHLLSTNLTQDRSYDMYGNIAFSNASLYHYAMSFPYRFIVHFSHSFEVQIIFLRLINIAMAASGLLLFSKLFIRIGVSKSITNLVILFFSIVPLFIFVSATISYDNMLFPISAYFFLVGVNIVKANEIQTGEYVKFVTVGLLGVLVKFTFMPILIVGLLYVAVLGYRMHGRKLISTLTRYPRSASMKTADGAIIVVFVLFSVLFVARYAYPVLRYHTPLPDCSVILTHDRCETNGVYYAVELAKDSKNQRTAKSIEDYLGFWIGSMTSQFEISASPVGSKIEIGRLLPIIYMTLSLGTFTGLVILLYMWRSLKKSQSWYFLITLSLALVISLFMFNASAYYSANTDLNTQTRYLLSVMPIFMVMAAVALNTLIGKRPALKLAVIGFLCLLCTQGAGDIKHILVSSDSWYWDNNTFVQKANSDVRSILKPLVKENP